METTKTNYFLLTQCRIYSADSKEEAFMNQKKTAVELMCT